MFPVTTSGRLEFIPLRDSIVSFSQMKANPVRYHHWHQCLEFLFVEEGYGVVVTNGRHYSMRPGRLFIFPPFTLHKITVEECTSGIYRRTIMHVDQNAVLHFFDIFPGIKQKFRLLAQRGGEAFVTDLEELHSWLDTLFTHYSRSADEREPGGENIATLLISLLSMLPATEQSIQEDEYCLSHRVMLWVEENYMKKFSLSKLAADLNQSKNYISRRFHDETGEKINEYITTYRLRQACQLLLRSRRSISEIAKQVGYSDTTYFITAFKKGTGVSPLQYRKHHEK